MGKQKQLKKMKREMRAAEVLPPVPVVAPTREKHYVTLQQAFEMFPDEDKGQLASRYALCLNRGLPGIPVWMPVFLTENSESRIRKAYLKGGYSAVEAEYDRVNKIIQHNKELAKAELAKL